MKKKLIYLLGSVIIVSAMTSCEKELLTESESEEPVTELTTSRLSVQARAAGDEGVVSYPVAVYVMNAQGSCVKREQLSSASDKLSLTLPSGTYQVYAVAGVTESQYILPTADQATASSVVTLQSGAAQGDLMTASSVITLGDGESNLLTLSMVRKVMLLQQLEITDIPQTVEAVEVSLYPLYQSIQLNGSYTADQTEQTVQLVKQSDGTTWKNSETLYLLPAAGNATVKVSMTADGKKESFSYACTQALTANHQVSITGQYTGTHEITLAGTITGAVWDTPTIIHFTFGADTTPDNGTPTVSDQAPAVNTVYQDCFVVKVDDDTDGEHAIVTLIHKKAVDILGSDRSEADVMADIQAALPSFAVNGITGWRLPTETELRAFGFGAFNQAFKNDAEATACGSDFYYYQDGETLRSCVITTSAYKREFTYGQKLRPVTTLRMKK